MSSLPNLSALTLVDEVKDEKQQRSAAKIDQIVTFDQIINQIEYRAFAAGPNIYHNDEQNEDLRYVWLQSTFVIIRALQSTLQESFSRGSYNMYVTKSQLQKVSSNDQFTEMTQFYRWHLNTSLDTIDWGVRVTRYNVYKSDFVTHTAQEMFYTLYAAYYKLGPEIYGCCLINVESESDDVEMHAALYVMQNGVRNGSSQQLLINSSSFLNNERIESMSVQLLNLFERAATHNLLILDAKPDNLIWLDSSNGRREPRFIDFDSRWTMVVQNVSHECALYINLILYLTVDICYDHEEQVLQNHLQLNSKLVHCLHTLVQKGASDKLCVLATQMNRVSANDLDALPNIFPLETIAKVVHTRARHYCVRSKTNRMVADLSKWLKDLHERLTLSGL
jgi:hypothetical protein